MKIILPNGNIQDTDFPLSIIRHSASHILAQPFILPKDQALKLTKERNEPYKVELIQDLQLMCLLVFTAPPLNHLAYMV